MEKTFVCLLKQRSGYFCQEKFWQRDILVQLEQLEDGGFGTTLNMHAQIEYCFCSLWMPHGGEAS